MTSRVENPNKAMHRRSVLLLLASALPLAGCATLHPVFRQRNAPYLLGTGDRLRIIVFGQENLSNIYTVDSVGRISMPLIDAVVVAGLTTQQAESRIAERLRNGFIREPRVSVEVESFRPFFILGEVTNPGQFAFVNGGLTIRQAVAIAGRFSPRADKDQAEVTRRAGDRIVTGTVPITYPVNPGDTILIRERWL